MTTMTPSLRGRLLWYELMTTDKAAAERFYSTVVGWTTVPFPGTPQPYSMFSRGGEQYIGGVLARPDQVSAPPFWAMYIGVPDLEAATSDIESKGGKATSEVIDLPQIGRMRMMQDPQGAMFYIFQPSAEPREPEGPAEVGQASWHELMTTDAAAAMPFYQQAFGWEPTEAMDMGPDGTYQMFNRPFGMIGGMMNKSAEMAQMPPMWTIYFRVADLDGAVQRITDHGGTVMVGPMEVPGGDRIIVASDPQGAMFGLHEVVAK